MINTLIAQAARTRSASTTQPAALAAAGVRRAGRAPGRWKATRTSPRTTARRPRTPARRTPGARPPAGSRPPGAIRVCDLFDRPLVLSFWFTQGSDCADQQDVVIASTRRYRGRVNFLSLDIRDDRDTVRELIRDHRWKMPVGYDRDGAVGGLYRVGGCPTFAYVYPGGTLQSARASANSPRAQLDGRRRGAAARDPCGGGRLRWRRRRGRRRSRLGALADGRAGSRRTSPRSSPGSASPGSRSTAARAQPGAGARARLRDLSDRFYGAHAIHMREQPIPWAYRVFFRQIGLDPDRTRTPVEQLALERLHDGAFTSRGLPADALTIARSRPASRCGPSTPTGSRAALCIRDSAPGESLPGRPASCRRERW